ncbi:hypothetical protein [Draconibacterium halophilum]|uniref:Uncharacterized protein n=1 Tax=Draconibacterium halophilum TaxID=2706887 RepID=A0A6C0RGD4_9BACT|nr:hypothetical protein [Draconibacterium halophilum]QIA08131.1 hypothetical protein G0Q07_10555 [Draconibacterium halophilum]
MENNINLTGIIYKYEKLVQIPLNTPFNVYIAEASTPYADYYGHVPRMAKPNSIFLFTKHFYFLEELMCYSASLEKCLLEHINIASAIIESEGKQYAAIRIKDFPDYSQLVKLQECLSKKNVKFADKLHFDKEVKTIVSKPFVLRELEPDFYMDQKEEHKGYFVLDRHFTQEEFDSAIEQMRYNGVCKLFDAEQGAIFNEGKLTYIVRIFSETLNLDMLKCLNREFSKY